MPPARQPLWNNKLMHALTFALSIPVALFLGKLLAGGHLLLLLLITWILVITILLMLLRDKYWMVVAFAMAVNLPVLPINGRIIYLAEVVIPFAFIMHILRLIIKKDNIFHSSGLAIWTYTIIVAATFVSNPAGLGIIGSESFGARHYYRVIMGICAYLIICKQNISNHDTKLVIRFLIAGSFVSFGNIVLATLSQENASSSGDYYTWHQAMCVPPSMLIAWLISRYNIRDFISPHRKQLWIYISLLTIIAISGKRSVFATAALAPVITAWIRKQYRYIVMIVLAGILLLSITVYGHGRFYELPVRIQRTLVFLPGQWDSRLEGAREASFRAEIREIAWGHVRNDPLRGRWGFKMTTYDFHRINNLPSAYNAHVRLYSTSLDWHSTWLGIMADLGIPAAIVWAIFLVQAFTTSLKGLKIAPKNSSYHTLLGMSFLMFSFHLIRSYTSGNSSTGTYQLWWLYALAVATTQSITINKHAETSNNNEQSAETAEINHGIER